MKGHTFILICALVITKGDRAINGHHDPRKAPEICAAEETNGVLIAHENCNQFYICDAGVPVVFKCDGNLNYNTNGEFCDWPINVDCGDRTIREEENGDDQDNSATVHDDPNQATAICAAKDSEGVMIAHENCNQYYKCSVGIPVAHHCQGHLFYDPSKQYCDCVGFVVCGDRQVPESDKEDDDSNGNENGESGNGSCNYNPGEAPKICASGTSEGVLVAHKKCNKFYQCSQGTPVPIKCPGNLLFNPKADICDRPDNVECGDRTIPEGDNQNNGNDGCGYSSDSCNDNNSGDNGSPDNENGNNSDSGNGSCNCNIGEAPKICAEGSEGTLVAHQKCNKFYKCAHGKPFPFECPKNLLYNPVEEVCDWPENVECGERLIPDPNGNEGSGDSGNSSENNGTDNGTTENDNNDSGNGSGNYDPSEAPQICAADESDGVLIAHEKCNKYYICSFGKPVPMKCAGNLLFNPAQDHCDWPENVECGERVVPDASDNGSNGDSDSGDVGTGDNDNDGTDNGNNDNGNGNGDNDNGNGSCNCNPGEAPKICASEDSEGVLVAHEKCHKFYTCSEGKPVTVTCPAGLLYNPWDQVCDWPENVKCGDRVIPEEGSEENNSDDASDNGNDNGSDNGDNIDCHDDPGQAPIICADTGSEGVLVAHENCNQFYICSEGKPLVFSCSNNLLYNPKIQACDWPQNVNCGDRGIPEEDREDDSGDNGNDNTGNENGDNDNHIDSNDDPSQAPAICAATGSEGVLVAHEYCNQFYKCSEGKPSVLSCQSNLLYNPNIQACDWPENVDCGDRVIPKEDHEDDTSDNNNDNGSENDNNGNENGDNCNNIDSHDDPTQAPAICAAAGSEGVLVAHENCNQFYKCSEGKPTVLRCLNNLLYNPRIRACDLPENVNCGDRVIPEEDGEEENVSAGADDTDNGNGIDSHDDPSQAPAICAATGSEGVLVAHENCNQFYKCSEGKPIVLRCLNNLLYNPRIQACDLPENVNCGDRVVPEEDGEEENVSAGADDTDNGNGIDSHDDPSQAPAICAATGSEGVLVAHENCNQFYKCSEGKPTVLRCLNNLLYNPRIQACDLPENVNCGDRVVPEEDGEEENVSAGADDTDNGNGIDNHDEPSQAPAICAATGSEGVLVAHENCNQFYKCSEGKPIVLRCLNNLLYNPRIQACDLPENVNCGDRVVPEEDGEEENVSAGADDTDNGNAIDSHDDPSQAPAICAATGSEGVLVAHENCNQFYKCSEGKPIVLRCLNNLLYNPRIQACDLPENVNCGDRVVPEEDGEEENVSAGADDTDNENAIDSHDDPSQAPAICAATGSEGVLVAHENCNQFYKCSEGKPTVLRCLNNLLYNPRIQACDLPENVNCGDRVIPEEDGEEENVSAGADDTDNGNAIDSHDDPSQAPAICAATGSEGVLVAHENCNQFYKCSEGKPTVLRCLNNLLYNPRIQACDLPENVNCGDRVVPEEDGEEENVSAGADDTDNGNAIDSHDDPSQAPAICAATGSEGVLVAHENCNQFYKCSEGKPTELRCLNNLLYNPRIQACDLPENVNCGDRVIPEEDGEEENVSAGADDTDNGNGIDSHDDPSQAPAICAATGSEGVKVAHENCNQFYVCSEGKPSVVSCPNNLFYDPKIQECDWPQNVNCLDRLIPADDEEDNANIDADGESENDNTGNDDNDYDHYYSSNAAATCAAPGSDGVLIEHANCHQFYLCSEGKPIVLDCALNQVYNKETKQCDWQENVKCGNRFIPSDDSRSMSIALNKHLVSRKALRH